MLSLAVLSLISAVAAQQVGTDTAETHPTMSWKKCTSASSCSTVNGEVTIDSNWRWIHKVGTTTNCYDGNKWTSACSSNSDCAANCAIEGSKYQETYGVTTSGDALTLKFVTKHQYGTNVGSRLYLMNSATKYEMFNLVNNEFTFDVDLSSVECGLNSALYFVAMEADGGMASYPTNKAGAKYGTGYCDSQCARDLKFIGGQGNYEGWVPSTSDSNAGVGNKGACCAEIDVWESNSHSFALTPHACQNNAYHICTAPNCGGTYSENRFAGDCDANGCDYNPYRLGKPDFYGKGKQVDTSKKFTVVTQFKTTGMKQFFVQNGKRIDVPAPSYSGVPASSEITKAFCDNIFNVFSDYNRYSEVGGWTAIQNALAKPHVLVMSIWADHYAHMLWLDGVWPRDADASSPGKKRGDCPATSGVPDEVIANYPNAFVTWSNVRFGPIGATTGL
ncbi:unnamed protein product [Clonostachys solani]|uniref:Glucanase n=1 Tax=Clonostachys solani TaxID=160281 RepID=A0A9N9ZIB9_9HYPO|nr:unnamed protein product [Clonostachys solani]